MATKFKKYVIRPVRNAFVALLVSVGLLVYWIIPRRLILWLNVRLVRLAYALMPSLKQSMQQNIRTAFEGEMSEQQIAETSRECMDLLASTLSDYVKMAFVHSLKTFKRHFTFQGEENLQRAYNKGKGVICLVPHTPGWEFSAIMPARLGYKSFGVSSAIHNPVLNKMMIHFRESRGMMNITRAHNPYNQIVEYLKKGYCLIIMIDQDSLHIRGEFLEFFGKRAYTPIGVARLVMDTGASVVPMYTENLPGFKYRFNMLPEIPFEVKESDLETIRYNTQLHNDAIEQIIRRNPSQWVWMHERWKTTPESLHYYLVRRGKIK